MARTIQTALRSRIDKSRSLSSKKRPSPDDGDNDCCVCFENPTDPDSQGSTWKSFKCGHCTCDVCFARLEECPICRMGKDGRPGIARQQERERLEAEERAAMAEAGPRHTVVIIQGGGGFQGDHPFSSENTTFSVGNLPVAIVQNLPSILAQAMEYRGRNPTLSRSVQRMSIGERQHRASQLLRVSGGRIRIGDLLGHENALP